MRSLNHNPGQVNTLKKDIDILVGETMKEKKRKYFVHPTEQVETMVYSTHLEERMVKEWKYTIVNDEDDQCQLLVGIFNVAPIRHHINIIINGS